MRRRFATISSTLIDRDTVMRSFVRQRVWSISVLAKLVERAQHHVRSSSRLAAETIAGKEIVGCFQVIGDDNEQIPVARCLGLAAGSAAEQADLEGAELIDDPIEQLPDRPHIDFLSVDILGAGCD